MYAQPMIGMTKTKETKMETAGNGKAKTWKRRPQKTAFFVSKIPYAHICSYLPTLSYASQIFTSFPVSYVYTGNEKRRPFFGNENGNGKGLIFVYKGMEHN